MTNIHGQARVHYALDPHNGELLSDSLVCMITGIFGFLS